MNDISLYANCGVEVMSARAVLEGRPEPYLLPEADTRAGVER